MMNREERERIMEAVCEVCHWPYVYRDSEIMNDEKCKYCPVKAVLNKGGDVNE